MTENNEDKWKQPTVAHNYIASQSGCEMCVVLASYHSQL